MDVPQKKALLKRMGAARFIILLFCLVIISVVLYVMLFEYDPHLNSICALGSTCMDVVCMMALLILTFDICFSQERISKTTKLFLALMLGTMWALFFDFLTWSLDGSLKYSGWTDLFTIASLCSGSILAGVLSLYLKSYMEDIHDFKHIAIHARVCAILSGIAFLLTFILGATHTAYVFVDGHYETGVLYDAITIIPILTLVYMTGYIISKVKIIGMHDVMAVALYIFIMIAGALIEAEYGFGATYVAIAIADIYIFVMLQNQYVAKWIKKSNTDEVTGFYNRHAYEEELSLMEKNGISDDFVYVSMDVNGLKVVNDSLGHMVGDELLTGAAVCIKEVLEPHGKVFRIGGDEFVAFMHADADELAAIKERFEDYTSKWRSDSIEQIAISCGYVMRSEAKQMTLRQMAIVADKRMYENKAQYYRKKGVDRRGRRDAHSALCGLYTKILVINPAQDTYQIVAMNSDEKSKEKGFAKKTSEWLRGFAETGQVYAEDAEDFLTKTDSAKIAEYFRNGNECFRIIYRRRIGEEYRRVMMEIIPSDNSKEDSDTYYLYVKDISVQI